MEYIKRYKRKMTFTAHMLYLIFSLLYILGGVVDSEILKIFKVFPLLILMVLHLKKLKKRNVFILTLAVLCGALGDLILQYSGKDLFSLGAVFFLLGHICYNLTIIQTWKGITIQVLVKKKLILLIGSTTIISLSFMNLATTVTDQNKVKEGIVLELLCIYLVLLSLNCVNSLVSICGKNKLSKEDVLMFLGSINFMVSDNLLGKSIFGDWEIFGSHKVNSILIMGTYYIAQYLMFNSGYKLTEKSQREVENESLIENKEQTD